jgi:undecaprenyl-diphosphatase
LSHFEAVVLAIIEGITEFLPISSTGHMVIASHFLNIADDPFTKSFEVIIQLAAILTVCLMYRKKLITQTYLFKKMFIAFLPTAAIGFVLKNQVEAWLSNLLVVVVSLILGGIVLIWIDKKWRAPKIKLLSDLSTTDCLKLGLFQCLALVPGVSRSGSTIVGGLLLGLKKEDATEFSFFLAIPTMLAATTYKLVKLAKAEQTVSSHQWSLLLLGSIIAFIVAGIALKYFVRYVSQNGLAVFGWYRLGLGFILLFFYL